MRINKKRKTFKANYWTFYQGRNKSPYIKKKYIKCLRVKWITEGIKNKYSRKSIRGNKAEKFLDF